jgi:hypothetical protein
MPSCLLINALCAFALSGGIGVTIAANPQVSIGRTTIVGINGPNGTEFFGGAILLSIQRLTLLNLYGQRFHSLNLPSET